MEEKKIFVCEKNFLFSDEHALVRASFNSNDKYN